MWTCVLFLCYYTMTWAACAGPECICCVIPRSHAPYTMHRQRVHCGMRLGAIVACTATDTQACTRTRAAAPRLQLYWLARPIRVESYTRIAASHAMCQNAHQHMCLMRCIAVLCIAARCCDALHHTHRAYRSSQSAGLELDCGAAAELQPQHRRSQMHAHVRRIAMRRRHRSAASAAAATSAIAPTA
jgi:hypothetical protein